VTTAYGILRHCGIEIGKLDFLGSFRAASLALNVYGGFAAALARRSTNGQI
jgi:Domain of unknown function (DUF1993)